MHWALSPRLILPMNVAVYSRVPLWLKFEGGEKEFSLIWFGRFMNIYTIIRFEFVHLIVCVGFSFSLFFLLKLLLLLFKEIGIKAWGETNKQTKTNSKIGLSSDTGGIPYTLPTMNLIKAYCIIICLGEKKNNKLLGKNSVQHHPSYR